MPEIRLKESLSDRYGEGYLRMSTQQTGLARFQSLANRGKRTELLDPVFGFLLMDLAFLRNIWTLPDARQLPRQSWLKLHSLAQACPIHLHKPTQCQASRSLARYSCLAVSPYSFLGFLPNLQSYDNICTCVIRQAAKTCSSTLSVSHSAM